MGLAETVAAFWALGLMGLILNFIVLEFIQSGKDERLLQREFSRVLHHEIEYALWRDRQKKAVAQEK